MTTYLKTSLKGKVNNMPRFFGVALLPLFEAVINSIQAIQENGGPNSSDFIEIMINRSASQQNMFTEDDKGKIVGFEIIDTGIGFNDSNFDSFQTADTDYKMDKGCKGVGRFCWLRAFDRVEIESVFQKEESFWKRGISFSLNKGIESPPPVITDSKHETVVKLIGFKEVYQKQPSAYKTTEKIAQRILEHCLSYFITENVPRIVVKDTSGEEYHLQQMFQEIKEHIESDEFEIAGNPFQLSHVKLYSTSMKVHNLVLCASSRDVKPIPIASTLGVSAEFDTDGKKFFYAAYLSSPYLDDHVDASRTSFDIPNTPLLHDDVLEEEIPYEQHNVSLQEIENAVIERAKGHLAPHLESLQKQKQAKVASFIETNPALRFVPYYSPEVYDEIQPNTAPEKINEVLYRHKGKAEYELKKRGEVLLKKQVDSYEEIASEAKQIETQLEGFNKDQLTNYIVFRKLIIDLLDKKLGLNTDGKYANEDIIHDIIFPRKTTSDQIAYENHNLWLIDERLAFHSFAASDMRLKDYADSSNIDRPDIVIFSEIDENRVARSISIIELKKPQRENYDEDITAQLLRYVRELKNHNIKTQQGRELQMSDSTKFYCYAICDITDPIRTYADDHNYSKLVDELGYYSYNSKLNVHIEIIAFDKIVADAKKRHRIFFDKLGIDK